MLLNIYVVLSCTIWIALFIYLLWTLRQIPRLSLVTMGHTMPVSWPALSVIIPACNEADHIEAALSSLLAQDYPSLEIIVVNDRSTDETGTILDRMATRDTRIQIIHISHLPEGWLGKVHALQQGLQHAHGDWLLFSDADIHFAPGMLRRAMAYALATQADHLALLPRVILNKFWLAVAVRTFGLLFLFTTHAAKVHRSDNQYYIGVGAFNLVRRKVFVQTPGFEWLRLEPGDDAALGMMMKQAGGRARFALADEDLVLSWYPNLRAMFKGLEKNLFGAGAHYQWWRVVFQVLGAWALVVAPLVGLLIGLANGGGLLILSSLSTGGIHLFFSVLVAQRKPLDVIYLLLFPLGLLLVNAMMVRAAYCCLRNQGIDWRATHYSLAQLRHGQRIKF